MSTWDEAYFLARDEEEGAYRRDNRHPALMKAIYSGDFKQVYCYCLERSLPPMEQRCKLTSDQLTFHVYRAQRWFSRIMNILEGDKTCRTRKPSPPSSPSS